MIRSLAALVVALVCVAPAIAQIDEAPKVHVRFIPHAKSIAPGERMSVMLEEDIRPGWHTYWVNPGDAGAPTEVQWTLPAGWRTSSFEWPYPKKLPVGPLMDYGYEGVTWLPFEITAPASATPGTTAVLKAAVSWLVCKEVCIPEDATLILPLPVSAAPAKPDASTLSVFRRAWARLPIPSPWPARYALNNDLNLFVEAPQLARARPASAVFFPSAPRQVKSTGAQTLQFTSNGLMLKLVPSRRFTHGKALSGVLVLTSVDGSVQALNIEAWEGFVPVPGGQTTLVVSLLFAFLGGIILNLMPCVLPVLAMKALALAGQAGADRAAVRNEALAYGTGAVASFVALGLLLVLLQAGGAAMGWGFQLQEPLVVGGFALLMLAVGLNLSGVYEISPISAGDSLTRHGGVTGNFFTGVLAVAVAAPCTVPFMATAVGFALTQTAIVALSVFAALGLGFAAPFLLLGFWPVLQHLLPKPGPWMVILRQALAFPMYGAAVWLTWVFGLQTNADHTALLLAAMVAMALALWLWGKTRYLGATGRVTGAGAALLVFIASLLPLVSAQTSASRIAPARSTLTTGIPSEPFSQARLDELRRSHRAVFINATAAWCITCLANDARVFSDPETRSAFARAHVTYLLADWTNRNPEITALLQTYGHSGVPLYLYYAPGASAPKILPQVLTVGDVTSAIQTEKAQ